MLFREPLSFSQQRGETVAKMQRSKNSEALRLAAHFALAHNLDNGIPGEDQPGIYEFNTNWRLPNPNEEGVISTLVQSTLWLRDGAKKPGGLKIITDIRTFSTEERKFVTISTSPDAKQAFIGPGEQQAIHIARTALDQITNGEMQSYKPDDVPQQIHYRSNTP